MRSRPCPARLPLFGMLLLAASISAADDDPPIIIDTLPDSFRQSLELRQREIDRRAAREHLDRLEGVIDGGRTWRPGATVRVAFRNAPEDLAARISAIAEEWTRHGNLTFSFRTDEGQFRQWSTDDTDYSAEIRVGFHDAGDWSLVGTDSRNRRICGPRQSSMNLQGFTVAVPPAWEAIVRHEFGHAVGFQHEHQAPGAPCGLRYHDDEGYLATRDRNGSFVPDAQKRRPGVYTMLSGPPYGWSGAKVDLNLRPLEDHQRAFLSGPFDPASIMCYSLPASLFIDGEHSPCHVKFNPVLSPQDREIMALAYPKDERGISLRNQAIDRFERLSMPEPRGVGKASPAVER